MIDEVPHDSDDSTVDGFTYLAPSWQKRLADLSAGGEVVYIETDYFGGMGSQGAAAYRDQRLIFGPKSGGSGPISEALETIGVSKGQAYDAFEAIGLVRFRRMDDLKPEE